MGNDDWLSHLSDESQPKCEKSPPKSSKNEKLIFILHSTSDDWPSDPSNKSQLKCQKRPPKSSKMKCLVLDYIQLLMISRVIWVMKFNWNVIKGPLSHHKMKCSFLDYVQQVSTQGQICSAFSSPHGNAAHLWWAMYQWINPTLLQSIAFRLWQIYLPKIVRQYGQLSSSPTGSAAHLWWEMMIGWVIWVMKVNLNVKKAPLSHQKMKNSFLYYV